MYCCLIALGSRQLGLQQASHPSRILLVLLHGHVPSADAASAGTAASDGALVPLQALLDAAQGHGECNALVTVTKDGSASVEPVLRVPVSVSTDDLISSPHKTHRAAADDEDHVPSPMHVMLVDFDGDIPASSSHGPATESSSKPSLPLWRRLCDHSESQQDLQAAVGGTNLVLLDEGAMTDMIGAIMG